MSRHQVQPPSLDTLLENVRTSLECLQVPCLRKIKFKNKRNNIRKM